jgi:transposase
VSGGFRPECQIYFIHDLAWTDRAPPPSRLDIERILDDFPENNLGWLERKVHNVSDAMPSPRRRRPSEDAKAAALRAAGALHPRPERVQDDAFAQHEFFDRRDQVQVKYEMLRRHRVDGRPVTAVAAAFGASRQTFYVTNAAFTTGGLPGLLPRPRGPQRAHKCTDAILDFVAQWRAEHETAAWPGVADAVRRRFHVTIHPRSLPRALARREKKPRPPGAARP